MEQPAALEPRDPSWWSEGFVVAGIGVGALAIRLAMAREIPLSAPVSDMLEYWERAVHIAEHGRLYENSWRMPGYPAALALVFALTSGPSLAGARTFNAIAGALTAMLTYWLARRSASPRAALCAASGVALYPTLLIYTSFIATEAVVAVPLVAALIASTYNSWRAALVAGVFAGLTTLVRPAGVALLPSVLFALARPGDAGVRTRRRGSLPTLAAAMFALVLLPWWVHSARLYGRFVPLDTTGGINLAIGSGPLANGQWDWSNVVRLHSEYLKDVDTTTPAGADRAAALAVGHMRDRPMRVLRLVPPKLAALLAMEGREHAYLYSYGYFGPRAATTVWLWGVATVASFPLLLTLAVVACAVRNSVSARVLVPCLSFLVISLLMHAASFGDPRFHLPFVPVLAVLATGVARWRGGVHWWRLACGSLLLVWLATEWWRQLAIYVGALIKLAAPGGWSIALSFDDLL